MCLGYYKRPDMEPFDAEGWFDTGDLAYQVDDEGYIRINGRSKDIIIRGGENIPIVEIENLLYKHPAILAAALVGYPDSRLGERGCAFVVLRPGQTLDLASLQSLHGRSQGRQAVLARTGRGRRRTADDAGGQDPEIPAQGASEGVRRRPAERARREPALRRPRLRRHRRGAGHRLLQSRERLGREGGLVAALDVSARRLEPAVEELRAKGFRFADMPSTSADRAAVRSGFERIESDFGAPVAVLVNNAVWARFQPLADIDEETSRRMLSVGVEGLIWTTQAAAPQMARGGGGAIVNLTSVSASHPAKHSIAYSAVKAGVTGLTRASAMELGPDGHPRQRHRAGHDRDARFDRPVRRDDDCGAAGGNAARPFRRRRKKSQPSPPFSRATRPATCRAQS